MERRATEYNRTIQRPRMKQSRRSYAAEGVLASPREERLGGSEYRQVGKRGYEGARGREKERKKGKKRRKKLDRE